MRTDKRAIVLGLVASTALAVAGCATQPYGGSNVSYSQGYPGQAGSSGQCQTCGVVQDIQQVTLSGSSGPSATGMIIGAVAGGLLGNTVGKGDGRKAATVAGAVAGGAVGNSVAQGQGSSTGWRIVVKLDDGRFATVTQRENPGVRNGDYVQVRNDRVYRVR